VTKTLKKDKTTNRKLVFSGEVGLERRRGRFGVRGGSHTIELGNDLKGGNKTMKLNTLIKINGRQLSRTHTTTNQKRGIDAEEEYEEEV
jgi:hypothetical protein